MIDGQLTLARASDIETSRESASANPGGRASHRRACLSGHVEVPGGLIDDELAEFLPMDSTECTRRCSDLRNMGLLEWLLIDGEPVTRLTRSGRRARVSVITQAGREALA